MYLIFSGNHEEHLACIKQVGIQEKKVKYVSTVMSLSGLSDVHVLFYGTYRNRSDYIDILDYVRQNRTCRRIETTIVTNTTTNVKPLKSDKEDESPLAQYIKSKYDTPLSDTLV